MRYACQVSGNVDWCSLQPYLILWICAQVVFAGRPGVVYGPVKTQFGFHLILIKSLS